MRRFWALTLVLLLAAVLAMAATVATPLGTPLWHYNVSLVALALLALPALPLLKRRRVATLAMGYTGLLATVTGFVMLYTKQLPNKEWMTWWHSVTSFAFLGFFLIHWWNNQPRLANFTRRLANARPQGPAAATAWTAGILLGITTATPDGRALFTTHNYLLLSTWVVWITIALTWGAWLWYRREAPHARLQQPRHRATARALVDTSLFLVCWLSILTGFLLLYLKPWLLDNGFKYASKWWHSATSILLLGLLALHIGFNARLLRAHANRVDGEMAGPRGTPAATVSSSDEVEERA